MQHRFIVYCHLNKVNGKRYIGITSQKPNERFRNGNGYKSSPHFYRAIQTYGWESFEHQILCNDLSEDEAKEKEKAFIAKYNTMDSRFGYNLTPGGEGYSGKNNPWFGKHHSEESKQKMSKQRKGVPKTEEWKKKISEANKGKVVSETTKEKMRQSHADFSGQNHPMYGRKVPKEHIDKRIAL